MQMKQVMNHNKDKGLLTMKTMVREYVNSLD